MNISYYSCHLLKIGLALSISICISTHTIAKQLPLEAFASLPSVKTLRLSPDGKHILSLQRLNTEAKKGSVICIYNIDKKKNSCPLYTDNTKSTFNWVRWGNNSKVLVSLNFAWHRYGTPTTETQLHILDIKTKKSRNAIPKKWQKKFDYQPQLQDQIVDILPEDDKHFLLQLDGFYKGQDKGGVYEIAKSVYKVSLHKPVMNVVQRSKIYINDWTTDRQRNIRIGIYTKGTNYKIIHRFAKKKKWDTLWKFDAFSENQVWPMGFDEDPNFLYVRALHEGRDAVFRVDLRDETLKKELVYSLKDYDVDGNLIYSPLSKKIIGISSSTESGYVFFDEKYQALQEGINQAQPDTDNYFYSMSKDERKYILLSTNDKNPGIYSLGDRDKKSLTFITPRYTGLDSSTLVEKTYISYKARDGLKISGYLSLPKGAKKGEQLPTIIFPHGGPISYDGKGFDYWTQFFANRGYAVLQMNFRGSSGYGYDFMKAGLQNWGLAMQDDVEDGARWLIKEGYSDPDH